MTTLSNQELEKLVDLGKKIQLSLSCDANEIGIPCFKYVVSAKSDPEMVYRGVMTMCEDY